MTRSDLQLEVNELRTEVAKLSLASPEDLRERGWQVAVHNDYRVLGKGYTFWLLTHHDGTWVKGEGATDAMALEEIRDELARREQQ